MKQKIVVQVSMTCDECRSKALQTVSRTKGLVSVAIIEGPEKDRVVVVGEDIDAVWLLDKLRKKVRDDDIVTVQEIKPPLTTKLDEEKFLYCQPAFPHYPPPYPTYSHHWYPVRDADPSCIIL